MGVGKWKLASVATTILGSGLIGTVFNFYYVRVFQRYGVSPAWLDVAETSLILINIVLEPTLGIIQDFASGGLFRNRRRMILFGGPFLVGSFLLPWFPWASEGGEASWLIGVHLVLVLFCWNLFFVATLSAYCGLYAEVSNDPGDRVLLFSMSMMSGLLGRSVIFPIEKASSSLHDFALFQKLCVGVGGGALLCFLVTGLTASDVVAGARPRATPSLPDPHHAPDPAPGTPPPPVPAQPEEEQDSATLVERERDEVGVSQAFPTIWQIFHSPNFWSAILSNFTGGWMRSIGYANFLAIYTGLVVPRHILPTGSYQFSVFVTFCQLFPIAAVAGISHVAKRYSIQRAIQCGYLGTITNSAVALLLKPLVGYVIFIPFLVLEGLLASFGSMYSIVIAEVIDEDSAKHDRALPVSTLIYTLNGAVVRGSIGLAPILVTAALNTAGYQDYVAGQKADAGLEPGAGLRSTAFLVATLYPALLAALSLAIFSPYSLPAPLTAPRTPHRLSDASVVSA